MSKTAKRYVLNLLRHLILFNLIFFLPLKKGCRSCTNHFIRGTNKVQVEALNLLVSQEEKKLLTEQQITYLIENLRVSND